MKKYFVFHTTSLVFKSEKIIKKCGIDYEIVPTPKLDGHVYCGVCICVDKGNIEGVEEALIENYIEYKIA
ncbi:DUF3343 domain-containing protein [Sporanaerobacter acetigenes]|uniref:DUF3343 domain-containing protein n=1 Tax=Sporanaerobacter acetigenes TaxID=165813 RepID=UPI0033263F28